MNIIRRIHQYVSRQSFPDAAEDLAKSDVFTGWWYYSVELMPGLITKGQYPDSFPMLPRILLRNCDLRGTTCLDVGSMEGLIPVVMCRQGAKTVLATDAIGHCREKMAALRHYYQATFEFQKIGLMYDLTNKLRKLGTPSFDVINLSGVLYHVFSPLMVLAGVRALLKRNGLMIVSTNVVIDSDFCSRQAVTQVAYSATVENDLLRDDTGTIDLLRALPSRTIHKAEKSNDGHILHLAD